MARPAQSSMVIGRYTLFAALASGGMGTVHLATCDEGGGTHVVAVKRLHPHLRTDKDFATMLLDEARLAVSIRHPNVVEVVDIVSTATDLLLVMEYVAGLSLHELITHGLTGRRRVAVPLPVAMAIAIDGLHGLHAAHEALGDNGQPLGLIHRDVSPQNLLVDTSGVTKLTDFGVAKAAGRLRSTHDGTIRGKIAYMSPEQVADSELDARSDIYSFAVVLWELLAGRPMFEADSDVALFGKAMRGPTERVAEVVPDLPAAIDAAIWRALARDPRRRFPTAQAFADALVAAYGPVDRAVVAEWMKSRAPHLLDERARTVDGLIAHEHEEDTITDTITDLVPTTLTPRHEAPLLDPDALITHPIPTPRYPIAIADSNIAAVVAAPPSPPPSPPRDRRMAFALVGVGASSVIALALVLGGGGGGGGGGGEAPVPAPAPASAPPPAHAAAPAASSPPPVVLAPPPPLENEPPVVLTPPPRPENEPPSPSARAQQPSEPAARARVTTGARPSTTVRTRAPAKKDPKADCNPPYTEDEQGKHFKPWCLR
ncbi:MAG: serine/threonine protein kinase [Labilithrix sp.]|nr:serine/threonine protein kinase [Labilithrix sp.]MCW5815204.1 serine/threonine protein kinase [Labilithrix sp.]